MWWDVHSKLLGIDIYMSKLGTWAQRQRVYVRATQIAGLFGAATFTSVALLGFAFLMVPAIVVNLCPLYPNYKNLIFIGCLLGVTLLGFIVSATVILPFRARFRRAVVAAIAEEGIFLCPRCAYDVRSNVLGRCPECGEALAFPRSDDSHTEKEGNGTNRGG